MAQPVWVSPAPGIITSIPQGVFWSSELLAVDPEGSPVYYEVVAGSLPPGIQITETGAISGVPEENIQGVPTAVQENTTSKFAVRAYTLNPVTGIIDRLADRTFELTVIGQYKPNFITPAGSIGQYYTGQQVAGLQVEYTTPIAPGIEVVQLISGQLPPGLTISPTGLISGFLTIPPTIDVLPGYSRNGSAYDQYPFDFTLDLPDITYSFTLSVSNPVDSDVRTFTITVYGLSTLTASNTFITADNTFITADVSPLSPPVLVTPIGSIGTTQNDSFYAFQFIGYDVNGEAFTFSCDDPPPGLTLDPNSGWMYGYIPNLGISTTTYDFSVYIENLLDPTLFSGPYEYSLTIEGPVSSGVIWLNGPNLGNIDNGGISTFSILAENPSGLTLQYQLASGSESSLPQGLTLTPGGEIVGRVSFDTFALDGGATTFDVLPRQGPATPTTFDMTYTFVVNAYSTNLINVVRTFSITVVRRYNVPYDNLYIQAMPPMNDRALINNLIQNTDIFPPSLIYRYNDTNFGVAKNVTYYHAYGLESDTLDTYVEALSLNHYWKQLTLGEISTAQALDDDGNILYEVVYSKIVDDLMNSDGQTVGKQVLTPYPILDDVTVVYPNGLEDMRTQVIDVVGQVSNILPRWMLSKQSNGQVLGFVPAWVIAYTKPGESGQIAYNIRTKYSDRLNLIDFEVDRYELDCQLSKNWDPYTSTWNITGITGNGRITTVTFGTRPTVEFAIGDPVKITGCVPASFNGTYYVTSASHTQVTYRNTTNDTATTVGTISTLPHWIPHPPVSTTFDIRSNYQYDGFSGGTGYRGIERASNGTITYPGDRILILGSQIGGIDTVNDMVLTVNTVDESGTIVSAFYNGTAPYGSMDESFTAVEGTNITGTGVDATWDITIVPGIPTVFDGGSMQFIAPIDMYTNTNEYDKYLVFPKRNILG